MNVRIDIDLAYKLPKEATAELFGPIDDAIVEAVGIISSSSGYGDGLRDMQWNAIWFGQEDWNDEYHVDPELNTTKELVLEIHKAITSLSGIPDYININIIEDRPAACYDSENGFESFERN